MPSSGGTSFSNTASARAASRTNIACPEREGVAAAVGKPGAVRAAGSANGANNVAVLIPCHRVIRTGGALGGYAYGLERKANLLAKEGRG